LHLLIKTSTSHLLLNSTGALQLTMSETKLFSPKQLETKAVWLFSTLTPPPNLMEYILHKGCTYRSYFKIEGDIQ
ncbi:Hypothetical predicted protein, partial [Marmota monax]